MDYKFRDNLIEKFFLLNGIVVIFILLGIFLILLSNSLPAISSVGVSEFLTSARWNPTAYSGDNQYGILAKIVSTLMVTFGSMLIAVPLGVAAAAYLSEVASSSVRSILKPALEILASIPSVVIGFLAIVVFGPLIAETFNLPHGLNAVNGSIALAIMSLPTIISLSEDAMSSVPTEYRKASLGLGANRWQTLTRVTIPSSLSGIFAAVMLGMGRAIGETMAVLMATGNAPRMPGSFFDSVQTMTATIAIELGEVPYYTEHYHALFVIGLVLFIMTFMVNLASDIILHRYRRGE